MLVNWLVVKITVLLWSYYKTAPSIQGTQKGTIILTTTQFQGAILGSSRHVPALLPCKPHGPLSQTSGVWNVLQVLLLQVATRLTQNPATQNGILSVIGVS